MVEIVWAKGIFAFREYTKNCQLYIQLSKFYTLRNRNLIACIPGFIPLTLETNIMVCYSWHGFDIKEVLDTSILARPHKMNI